MMNTYSNPKSFLKLSFFSFFVFFAVRLKKITTQRMFGESKLLLTGRLEITATQTKPTYVGLRNLILC